MDTAVTAEAARELDPTHASTNTRDTEQFFTNAGAHTGLSFQHSRDSKMFNLGGGAAIGDYNNDGLLDVYAVNSNGPNALYRNNLDGTFVDVADTAGVAGPLPSGNGAGWADYDNDGNLDLFVAAWGASRLFHNNGPPTFTFTDVTRSAGVGDPDGTYRTMGVAWGDYDSDGYLDLLVVRHLGEYHLERPKSMEFRDVPRPIALYHNDGDGTFTDKTSLLGNTDEFPSNVVTAGFKPGFLDFDNDGDPDIYLVNDFGSQLNPNVLWRNDGPINTGEWQFSDVSAASGADLGIFGMGLAVGDYDNDGDFDLYMTNMGPNQLLRNEGDGTFSNTTEVAGVGRATVPGPPGYQTNVGWGTGFFDFNNDGLLDLYAAAGFVDMEPFPNPRAQPNVLFVNRGDGTFEDVSLRSGADDTGIGRGVAIADFNNDGCEDIFVLNLGDNRGTPGVSRAMWNNCSHGNNWLTIKLVSTASNRDGIGARLKVTTESVTQIREMGCSQSHISHSVIPAHFGLGQAKEVDAVEIRWPSGRVQTLADVAVNQKIVVTEP